jgi:hypothetical protein
VRIALDHHRRVAGLARGAAGVGATDLRRHRSISCM